MKVCPKCSAEFEDKFKFCRNDGMALEAKTSGRLCPKCGKETEQEQKFCRQCGARLETLIQGALTQIEKPDTHEVSAAQEGAELPNVVSQVEEKATNKTDTLAIPPISAVKCCPICGGGTKEAEQFCRHCGGTLESPTAAAAEMFHTADAQQVMTPQEIKIGIAPDRESTGSKHHRKD